MTTGEDTNVPEEVPNTQDPATRLAELTELLKKNEERLTLLEAENASLRTANATRATDDGTTEINP